MIRPDHIGLPAYDRYTSASFLTWIFDLEPHAAEGSAGHFASVPLNNGFTIDFYSADRFDPLHVAFRVDSAAFAGIIARLRSRDIPFGSDPNDPSNGRLDHPLSPQGAYFRTPDGHLFEIMEAPASASESGRGPHADRGVM